MSTHSIWVNRVKTIVQRLTYRCGSGSENWPKVQVVREGKVPTDSRMVRHNDCSAFLCGLRQSPILLRKRVAQGNFARKVCQSMNASRWAMNSNRSGMRIAALACAVALFAGPAVPAIKNLAVVTSASSKLQDVPLAELAKLCKGAQKAWADGRSFTLVMKDPASPDMHIAVQKLFGASSSEVKTAIAKVNEARAVVRVVESDEDLLHTVDATPGAVGILDVYAINSSVKVLRVDGKLPFDVGYALKGN